MSDEQEVLQCDFCETALAEPVGNVVIPADELKPSATVTKVRIECKTCASSNAAKGWHAIWELSWIAKEPLRYAFQIVGDQTFAFETEPKMPRYSEDALDDFLRIFHLIHPALFGGGPWALRDEAG
jgi:hypothetical protein